MCMHFKGMQVAIKQKSMRNLLQFVLVYVYEDMFVTERTLHCPSAQTHLSCHIWEA